LWQKGYWKLSLSPDKKGTALSDNYRVGLTSSRRQSDAYP
jgi:hypothetical protein